jgi:hypothetical protein
LAGLYVNRLTFMSHTRESHLSNAEPAGAGRIGGFTGYAMALDSIEGSLKERGVRLTRQRQILLELIDKTGEHLDAERLFQMAKEKDPKLNRVTVWWTNWTSCTTAATSITTRRG